MTTMGQPVAEGAARPTDPREGHAEQVRACIFYACPHTVRRAAAPSRREPGRGHSDRYGRGDGRCAGLLPQGRVLLGHDRHHDLRLLRPRRRQHGPAGRYLQSLGRVPRLDPGPGRRRGDLRRLRALVRGQGRRQRALCRRDLLPGQRPGGLVHEGARRVDRAAGRGQRSRGARRAAGDLAGRGRVGGSAQVRCPRDPGPAADRAVDRRRGQPDHARAAGRDRAPRIRGGRRAEAAAGPGSGTAR